MRGRDAGKDAHLQLLRGELSELNRLVFGFDMELRAGSTGVRPKDLSRKDAKRDRIALMRRCQQK